MPRHFLPNGEWINYNLCLPALPGRILAIYLHGFASHRGGEKALYFRDSFTSRGAAYLTFDFRGHGSSSGTLVQMSLSRCLDDLSFMVDGPGKGYPVVILVGASMGAQVAAWWAAQRPGRIQANLLIAPSFSFHENRIRDLGPEGVKELRRTGQSRLSNRWIDVMIGSALIEDAANFLVEDLIGLYRTPTLIFHGTTDESVSYEESVSFVHRSAARPLSLVLVAGGDHRLTNSKEFLFRTMSGFLEESGIWGDREG